MARAAGEAQLRPLAYQPGYPIADIGCACDPLIMSDEAKIVDAVCSVDGLRRWELIRRPDGLYSYNEDTFYREKYWAGEDRSEHDTGTIEYWAPTNFSGLFDTVEAARQDALGCLPWLYAALGR